jgi:glycosyltransferase involved in cell wall biosynthesis
VTPRFSIVVPVHYEGHAITRYLDRLFSAVTSPCEVIIVYDTTDDPTAEIAEFHAAGDPRVRPTLNTYGPGPANAIRFGIDNSIADVVVVTMADGSDDPEQIEVLVRLVERGVVVAAASRYMPGGQQVGGPFLKRTLSRLAGKSLFWLARVGTHDATNSFKAYSREFVTDVGIDSRHGFEIGIELTAKARRLRRPVAEVPTIWLERQQGVSNFKVGKWIPKYLRWYLFSFGPRLSVDEARVRAAQVGPE